MDLIEKEIILDALDEIESEVADGDGFQYEKWRRYFCELPSEQPEPSQVARDIATIVENEQDMRVMLSKPEIVICKDCKHWINGHLCESLSRFGSFETEADFYCGFACKKVPE